MPRPTNLSLEDIQQAYASEPARSQFPPILTLKQFAELLQISLRTAKFYIASGDFDGATTLVGKHRRIWRDLAIQLAFSRHRVKPRNK